MKGVDLIDSVGSLGSVCVIHTRRDESRACKLRCPHPSAARGIVESLYYHPGIRWHIRRIYVLNPIEFTTIRRNEVKKQNSRGHRHAIAQGKEDEPYLVTTKQIVQRASMVLTNVHYIIEAEFEMLPEKAAPGDNPGKFQDIVTRRMRKRPVLFHPVLRLPRVSRTLQAVGGWSDPDD